MSGLGRDRAEALAAAIGPQEVRDYLRSRGWSAVPSRRREAAIFRHETAPRAEVYIPLDRSLGDYADAMAVAAGRIGEQEGRSRDEVLRDLRHPRKDLLRFGLEGSDAAGGAVSLFDGESLVIGVRKALLASGCSVEKPGQRFYPRSLREAEAFVSRCELGQTEVGSFVVTVAAPLDTDEQLGTNGIEPFGRQATKALLRALAHLARALGDGEPERVLTPSASDPVVSANLCEALVEMAPKREQLDLRVRASWSPILSVGADVPATAYFERGTYSTIAALGRQLRPGRAPKAAQFVGVVSQLAGDPGADGRLEGDVQLSIQVDEELVHARVTLGHEDYLQAGRAHLGQRYVKVRGVLHRGTSHSYADGGVGVRGD